MVRDTDTLSEFRHAMGRIVDRLDKHDEGINRNANDTREHILRCEGANVQAARDLGEIRTDMATIKKAQTYIYIGLAVVLAVQVLGVERAWQLTDSIKALRTAIPIHLSLPEK